MFTTWMKFALATARLGQETQQVMALRMMKIARGGTSSHLEVHRMLTEKGFALAEAASTLAVGPTRSAIHTPLFQQPARLRVRANDTYLRTKKRRCRANRART